jgi:hypothetical protein
VKRILVAATFAALYAGTLPAFASGLTVSVTPSQVSDGQTANVYGTGFCPTGGGCSTVSIAVDANQVASGVPVGSNGSFHATFVVNQFSGSHTVTATQPANGQTLQAKGGMTVALTDTRRPTPTPPGGGVVVNPPTTQPEISPAPTPGGGPSPSDQPSASPTPTPTTASSPGLPGSGSTSSNPWLGIGALILALLVVVGGVVAIVWRRRRDSS